MKYFNQYSYCLENGGIGWDEAPLEFFGKYQEAFEHPLMEKTKYSAEQPEQPEQPRTARTAQNS